MDSRAVRAALLLLVTAVSFIPGAHGYSSDVDALLAVRDALGGAPNTFSSWDPSTNPCDGSWLGVKCSGGRVINVNLYNETLDGTISPSIAALTELQVLILKYNRLRGVVPDVFGNMTNLVFLDLSLNQFVGPIPPSMGGLSNLTSLFLSSNNFNNSIPATLGNLTNLQIVNISANDLHGSFPSNLLTPPFLAVMDASNNTISGPLPSEVSPSLILLNVENNKFNGTIPETILTKGNLVFRFGGNLDLRLPAPAPAPAPKNATSPAPAPAPVSKNATSPAPAPISATSPAPAPRNAASPSLLNATSAAPAPLTATSAAPAPLNATSPARAPASVLTPVSAPSIAPTAVLLPTQSANVSNGNVTAGGGDPSSVTPSGVNPALGAAAGDSKDSGGSNTGVIVGATLGGVAFAGLAAAALLAVLARRRRRSPPDPYLPTNGKDAWQITPDVKSVNRSFGSARVYPLPLLMRGTHGFAESQQVGSSPGSKVYLATLPEGGSALVKRRDPPIAGFQSKSEFEEEVAELGRLNHRNLVPLAGCCDDDKERILIFSAPHTSSLRDYLTPGGVNTPLEWTARLEIASGTAAALAYLHSESGPHRLYEELASTSVLVDEHVRPKMADFHLEGGTETEESSSSNLRASTERLQTGSWLSRGDRTVHADVYNLGVILLELTSGRPAVGNSAGGKRELADWALSLLAARDYDSVLDPHLVGDCTDSSLANFCELAQDCLSEQANARPTLPEIQRRLAQCLSLQSRDVRPRGPSRQPSMGSSSFQSRVWQEEDEYEVRDLPDNVPLAGGLGGRLWEPMAPTSSARSDGSIVSYQIVR